MTFMRLKLTFPLDLSSAGTTLSKKDQFEFSTNFRYSKPSKNRLVILGNSLNLSKRTHSYLSLVMFNLKVIKEW